MIRKLIMIFCIALLSACSSGPSGPELSSALEQFFRADAVKQFESMKAVLGSSPQAIKRVKDQMEAMGIPQPENIFVKEFVLEEQTEKENGDFISKATMFFIFGEKKSKRSMRITTTITDGKVKILEPELEFL